jgi:hypothetical protein
MVWMYGFFWSEGDGLSGRVGIHRPPHNFPWAAQALGRLNFQIPPHIPASSFSHPDPCDTTTRTRRFVHAQHKANTHHEHTCLLISNGNALKGGKKSPPLRQLLPLLLPQHHHAEQRARARSPRSRSPKTQSHAADAEAPTTPMDRQPSLRSHPVLPVGRKIYRYIPSNNNNNNNNNNHGSTSEASTNSSSRRRA